MDKRLVELHEQLMPRAEILALMEEHFCAGGPKTYADPESVRIREYMGFRNEEISLEDEFFDYVQTAALFFACPLSVEEIRDLHKKKARVSDLLDILATRAPRRRLQPKVVLGKPCLPAGVFEELVNLASIVKGRKVEAAPSTPLIETLDRRELRTLVIMTNYHFPEVQSKRDRLWGEDLFETSPNSPYVLLVSMALSMLVFFALSKVPGSAVEWLDHSFSPNTMAFLTLVGFAGIFTALFLLARSVMKRVHKHVNETKNPFKRRIRTFRDLVGFLLREGGARYIESPQ